MKLTLVPLGSHLIGQELFLSLLMVLLIGPVQYFFSLNYIGSMQNAFFKINELTFELEKV